VDLSARGVIGYYNAGDYRPPPKKRAEKEYGRVGEEGIFN
jgi:hypothetical protein